MTEAQGIFFPGVLVLNLSTVVVLLHVHIYLFENWNRCEHAKGNMQKTGKFHLRKQWKTIKYMQLR